MLAFASVESAALSVTGDELIRNTNGNQWIPSGVNVQLAIDDLNDSGTVWVGSDVTLYMSLRLKDNVQVDFLNNKVTLLNNCEFFNVTAMEYAIVRNAFVIPTEKHTSAIIKLYVGPGETWASRIRYNLFENIQIKNPSPYTREHNFTGIHIQNLGESNIFRNTFRNIIVYGSKTGIHLECTGKIGWCNGNTFENIWIDRYVNGIWFDVSPSSQKGFNQNLFQNVKLQTVNSSVYYTEPIYGVRNISHNGNRFTDILIWDWHVVDNDHGGNGVYEYWIGPDATNTYINAHNIVEDYFLDEGKATVVDGEGGYLGTWEDYNDDWIHEEIENLSQELTILKIVLIVVGIIIAALFLARKKLRSV